MVLVWCCDLKGGWKVLRNGRTCDTSRHWCFLNPGDDGLGGQIDLVRVQALPLTGRVSLGK